MAEYIFAQYNLICEALGFLLSLCPELNFYMNIYNKMVSKINAVLDDQLIEWKSGGDVVYALFSIWTAQVS